jgi:hypothetical protein
MKLEEENPLVERTINNGDEIVKHVFKIAEEALAKYGMDLMFFGHGDACFDNMQEDWFKKIPFDSHELYMIKLAHQLTDLSYIVEAKKAGRI